MIEAWNIHPSFRCTTFKQLSYARRPGAYACDDYLRFWLLRKKNNYLMFTGWTKISTSTPNVRIPVFALKPSWGIVCFWATFAQEIDVPHLILCRGCTVTDFLSGTETHAGHDFSLTLLEMGSCRRSLQNEIRRWPLETSKRENVSRTPQPVRRKET